MVDGSSELPERIQPQDDKVQTLGWWNYACEIARRLRVGQLPPVVDVYGPILKPSEQGRLSTSLLYSRLYGGSGTYGRSNLFAFGSIPFMVGAYAVNELMNQSRKTAAQQRAAVQWRETQTVTLVVTSERVLCGTAQGWLSFWFATVTEFFPDLDDWSVTLGFGGETPPLRLSGPSAPAIALLVAHAVLGPRWIEDPRLDRLR